MNQPEDSLESTDRTKNIQLGILGMHCASCVSQVEKALQTHPGVQSAQANLISHQARVELKQDMRTDSLLSELTSRLQKAGFDCAETSKCKQQQPATADSKERQHFIVAALLLIGAMLARIPFAEAVYLQWLFATAILLFPGRPFLVGAWKAARFGRSNMDSLIALGCLVSYSFSSLAWLGLVGDSQHLFFDSALMLIPFVSLGKYLESIASNKARKALDSLLEYAPSQVRILKDKEERMIPLEELKKHDRIVVLPSERVGADGIIRRGSTSIDESMLSGESLPLAKEKWDSVTGGSLNISSRIEVEVMAVGADSQLANLSQLVLDAQAGHAPIQRLADRICQYFVPVVLLLAVATLLSHLFTNQGIELGLLRTVAVIVVACPCALGLATPMAILVGSAAAMEQGFLVKNGAALEGLARCKAVFFDKTGTLTKAQFSLTKTNWRQENQGQTKSLAIVAQAARESKHPLSQAIAQSVDSITGWEFDRQELPGKGLIAEILSSPQEELLKAKLYIGNAKLLQEHQADMPRQAVNSASSIVHIACCKKTDSSPKYWGSIELEDQAREGMKECLEGLSASGMQLVLLSGDHRYAVEKLAEGFKFDEVHFEQSPEDKANEIELWEKRNGPVAMVGDGMNDSIALAKAHVGIAVGNATEMAQDSGDIAFLNAPIQSLPQLFSIGQASLKKIKQNLFWAFAYNIGMLPLAAGALAHWGLGLKPAYAALAMACSSACVVFNSLLLRKSCQQALLNQPNNP